MQRSCTGFVPYFAHNFQFSNPLKHLYKPLKKSHTYYLVMKTAMAAMKLLLLAFLGSSVPAMKMANLRPAVVEKRKLALSPTTIKGWAEAAGITIEAVKELGSLVGAVTDAALTNYLNAASQVVMKGDGAMWVSSLTGTWGTWNGKLRSLYYHATLDHYTTILGRNGCKGVSKKAGGWADVSDTRAMWGNKSWIKPCPVGWNCGSPTQTECKV
jgi:hypothetical protein